MDFASKLPFARDRVIECYFWILGVYFEPKYYFARRTLTKVIAMTSIIDDVYDVYGTLEELDLFTRAIERFEIDIYFSSLILYSQFIPDLSFTTYHRRSSSYLQMGHLSHGCTAGVYEILLRGTLRCLC